MNLYWRVRKKHATAPPRTQDNLKTRTSTTCYRQPTNSTLVALFILASLATLLFNLTAGQLQSNSIQLQDEPSEQQPLNNNHNKLVLSRYVRHFEPLNYDHHVVHRRTKRDLSQQQRPQETAPNHPPSTPTIKLDFQAHNRDFKLRLKPDAHVIFAREAVIEDGDGRSIKNHLDAKLFSLTGHLHDQPNDSRVYGSLKKGIFEGTIHTNDNQVFYVERARKYVDELKKHNEKFQNISDHNDLDFHSVVYSVDDVIHPHSQHEDGMSFRHLDDLASLSPTCAQHNQKIKSWMQQVAESAVPGSEREHLKPQAIYSNQSQPKTQRDIFYERMSKMYEYSTDGQPLNFSSARENYEWPSTSANSRDNWIDSSCSHTAGRLISRPKREIDLFDLTLLSPKPRVSHRPPSEQPQRQKRACTLYIQTDTFLWNYTRKHHDNDLDTREDIASLVAQHIKAINHIYENSDFGGIRGLKFIVQRLRINDTSACDSSKRSSNPFCQSNIDVSNFLNLNSQFNHNDFCLAYIFTYRDFSGGTLGLAWVASTSGASGGICEKYKSYTENVNGRQVQTKRSLNTGIITFVNYNSRVPPKVSELTLAHEIGHNFGSPHDFPQDCRPGGSTGNYIMYSSATSGERSNNNKFSHCSIRNITAVLNAIISDGKDNCFEVDNGPFCGNKIVEDGEECDCGYNAQECTEQCCVPRELSPEVDYGGSRSCQRIRGKECSPSEGPCCSDECLFTGREKLCKPETECSLAQTCDLTQAMCPEPIPKPNMTECNNATQVCMNGKCGGSICMKYHMEECFLTAKTGAKSEDMCEVACQQPEQPNTCRRTSEIPEMRHMSGLKLRPGSPCNEFLGYCDVFQRCRLVDAEGPLARLKNTLLNQRLLLSIKQWAITHWWACALFAIGFMMLMYVFIECCAVHTPTSNPNKRPAIRISDTLRHPSHTLRRKRRSQGARRDMVSTSRAHDSFLFPARATA